MQRTTQFLKRRKFLLILPLIILPFLTLTCWVMGLGHGSNLSQKTNSGLNNQLPDAHLSNETLDKMSLYMKKDRDSTNSYDYLKLAPFKAVETPNPFPILDTSFTDQSLPNSGLNKNSWTDHSDPNEQRVLDHLKRLDDMINNTSTKESTQSNAPDNENQVQLQRLEQMMDNISAPGRPDPEMTQLSNMLEKILDIQTPGRAVQKLKELSVRNKGRVYTVRLPDQPTTAAYLSNSATASFNTPMVDSNDKAALLRQPSVLNRFYELTQTIQSDLSEQTAIPAAIHGTQTLISGAVVKMRLEEDIMLNGTTIAKGTFVYGNCTINGERMNIEIPGLRYGKNLYPVELKAYSLDGLEGIPIPGGLTRDAVKEGADRTVQNLQFMNMDPSLAGQAAGAGVEVAKGLFSKKVKLIRVTLKADFPILLMDEKASLHTH